MYLFFFSSANLQCALQSCNTAVYWKDPLLFNLSTCQAICKLFSIPGLFSCLKKRHPPEDDVAHRLCLVQLHPYRVGDLPSELTCNNWIIGKNRRTRVLKVNAQVMLWRECGRCSITFFLSFEVFYNGMTEFVHSILQLSFLQSYNPLFPPMVKSFSHLLVALWPSCSLISKKKSFFLPVLMCDGLSGGKRPLFALMRLTKTREHR